MKLASIEKIVNKFPHPNAEAIEFVQILGYKSIVKKSDNYQVGDTVIFIQPDTVLPDAPWAAIYKAKSNRVKAIKLRGEWSEGIVERASNIGFYLPSDITWDTQYGAEISTAIGVTKYEPPMPQDLQAKSGGLPFGIPITDEERYQNLDLSQYLGKVVDITLKRDGKSWTGYAANKDGDWVTGICGRRLEWKLDAQNDYTTWSNAVDKLREFAMQNNVSLAIRGEITGAGIQAFAKNPHANGPKELALFSTWLIDEKRYANKYEVTNYRNMAVVTGIRPIDLLEENVILTSELINKYAEGITTINGKPFEGVVIKGEGFSFKVINMDYDSKK